MSPQETRAEVDTNADVGPAIEMLRHSIATLAYRAARVLHGTPADFAQFSAASTTRTPAEILAHIGDLLDWARSLADGEHRWHDSAPLPWDREVTRFFDGLSQLDERLASGAIGCSVEGLFQGPIADALTHIGQLAMLRRLAGSPVRGENYFKADIVAGRVGLHQSSPRRTFE